MTYQTITKPQTECLRCNGSGYFGVYAHIANGTCFGCGGTGTVDSQKQYKATRQTAQPVNNPASKTIQTQELGEVRIEKMDSNKGFTAIALGCYFHFSVANNTIDVWFVPDGYKTHGITKESQLNKILQKHLKK